MQPLRTGAVPGSLEGPKVTPREPSEGWGTIMVMLRAGLAAWLGQNRAPLPGKVALCGGLGGGRSGKLAPTDALTYLLSDIPIFLNHLRSKCNLTKQKSRASSCEGCAWSGFRARYFLAKCMPRSDDCNSSTAVTISFGEMKS